MPEHQNQQAYDDHVAREKHCAEWLKTIKKPFAGLIKVVALIGVFNGLLIVLQSALLAHLFQQLIIDKQPWKQLPDDFLLLLAIFFIRSLCIYLYQQQGFSISTKIKRTVRGQLLDKFAKLGPAFIKQQHSGELAALTLQHVEALEAYFARYLPQQLLVAILPLVMIVIVFPVNWVVAVIFLVTGPLIPVFMALIGMGAASASRNQFLAVTRMSGYFLDRIQGLSILKLFGQAEAELQNINQVALNFREKTMTVLRIAFMSSAVLEFFSAVAVALVAVYVGLGLLGLIKFGPATHISLQEALFVLLLAPEFFNPLKQLAVHYHDKAAAIGAADCILKVLQQPEPDIKNSVPSHSDYSIEFHNVSKSYQRKPVINNFNLQIRKGEKIALVGESGTGKTTLINLLLGFESVDSGNILIKGDLVTPHTVARNIAWMGQQSNVFYTTIKDNISLQNPALDNQKIEAAAAAAGVSVYSERLPLGLLTRVGEKGYGLSGGEIQRLALARAFAKNSEIVLLDEPTAHLDQNTKIQLLDVIDTLFADKTLIIASHDPDVMSRMQRLITLS